MKRIVWLSMLLLGVTSCNAATQPAASTPAATEHAGDVMMAQHLDATMPRERQIRLAESAAPAEVSTHATIYILTDKGYVRAREGTNGFTCVATRTYFDLSANASGTTEVSPKCYDAEGSRTLLPVALLIEQLHAEGKSPAQIDRQIRQGYADHLFKAPSKPGLVYMMSGNNLLYDEGTRRVQHIHGHLMFYAPYMTAKDLGYRSGSDTLPFLADPGEPDTMMIVSPAM